jgi:hypothetical protein
MSEGSEGQEEGRKVLEFGTSSTVADFESALTEIAAAPADADLLLTRKQKFRFVAGTAAQLQLLVTWRHRCPRGRIRIHAHSAMDAEELDGTLENFVETDRGTIAASIAAVLTRAGDKDLSGPARKIADARLETLMKPVASRVREGGGRHVLDLCIDDSLYLAPEDLYLPKEKGADPKLRRLRDYQTFAKTAFARVMRGAGKSKLDQVLEPDTAALGELFKELFGNTEHWAKEDAEEMPYPRRTSARGIRVEGHDFKTDGEKSMLAEQQALSAYLARPDVTLRDGRRRLIETTIFDSGPGIAARELLRMERQERAAPDISTELTALNRCFEKHFTHATSGDRRGEGLHAAMAALSDLRAFLWVRSGRLSLYRDFIAHPYDPEQKGREPFLLDWTSGGEEPTELTPAQGSFITALIPITNASEQIPF